jgi:lysophospholipase L1-like esterase
MKRLFPMPKIILVRKTMLTSPGLRRKAASLFGVMASLALIAAHPARAEAPDTTLALVNEGAPAAAIVPDHDANRAATELPVPARVWIAAGRELNLWFDTLWPAETPPVDIAVDSPVGSIGERGFRFVPAPEQAGRSFPLTVRVQDRQARLLASRSFELCVAPAGGGGGRPLQLLFLGDSLTHGVPSECRGMISGEVKRLLEAEGGFRPLLLGRNDDMGDNRHEGLGGWSFRSFTTPGGKVTRFHVAGVTRKPAVFSAYRCGEVVYRIQSRTLVPAADGLLRGMLLGAVRALDNQGLDLSALPAPEPAGMLMRADPAAAGDATIAFSGAEHPVPANPFWDTSLHDGKGGLHPRKYLHDHDRFDGADRIDYALIQLGVNDCMGVAMRATDAQRCAALETILNQCRTLVRALQAPDTGYPDCRVILALTPIGCNSPAAYARSYGDKGVTMPVYEAAVRDLWAKLIREFDRSPRWPRVRLSINGLMTDRDRGYPKKEETIGGVPAGIHSNAVHPDAAGYRQCADAYYSVLRGWLASNGEE